MAGETEITLIEASKNTENFIDEKNKEPQGKTLGSDSSYTEDSEEFTDWSEEDEDEVRSQNVDEDFIDFPFSGKRHCGDGEEQPLSSADRPADTDEDKKNPAYVPRKGAFFEHDIRKGDDGDDGGGEEDQQNSTEDVLNKKKWVHDRFDEKSQAPKSVHELVTLYGFNIRKHEKYLGSLVRPVFKHRYRSSGLNERIVGKKRGSMMNKRNAFRTFIVVRNNLNNSVSSGKKIIKKESKNSKKEKLKNENVDEKTVENIDKVLKCEKTTANAINDKGKPGILKSSKVSNEDNETQNNKPSPKSYLAKSPAKTLSFDKEQDENLILKLNVDKKSNYTKNDMCVSSLKNQTSHSEDFYKSLNESYKFDYDFPSFAGEIFIGRPIYSIRGNFKKKKNMVGSGRIAPVIGSKVSSTSYNKEETKKNFDANDVSFNNNLIYTNSNMTDQINRKYKPEYPNKVVIEINNNAGKENNEEENVSKEANSYSNFYKYNKNLNTEGGFKSFNPQHSYTGWGRYRNHKNHGNRGWASRDLKYMGEAQDVRLIVMCGENQENNKENESLHSELDNATGKNKIQAVYTCDQTKQNDKSKKNRSFKGEFSKEGILPPMTCSMISRNKNNSVYSVAKSGDIDAKKELITQISNGNIHQNSNKNDSSSTSDANINGKKLPLTKNDNNKTNSNTNGKNKQGMYPRFPVVPKNRLFHPNHCNNPQSFVSTAFILPPGPILSSKQSQENPMFSHQLIALPVRLATMPYIFTSQQQLPQAGISQNYRVSNSKNKSSFNSSQNNQYFNPHFLAQNNFVNSYQPNISKSNDSKTKFPASKTLSKPQYKTSTTVSKPTSLPLFSTIKITPPPSCLSCPRTFTTTTITTPSALSLSTNTTTSSTTTTTFSAQTNITTTSTLSPYAAAFESNQTDQSVFKPKSIFQTSIKSLKKQTYRLTPNDTVYELTPLKFQPKCPIEVRGGTVYFSPEMQPKRISSAGKKPSLGLIQFSTGVTPNEQSSSRTRKALPIVDPKNLKELEDERKADGCESLEPKVSDNTQNKVIEEVCDRENTKDENLESGYCNEVNKNIATDTSIETLKEKEDETNESKNVKEK